MIKDNLTSNKINLGFCELFLRVDGIMQMNVFANTDIKAEHIELMVKTSLKLNNHKQMPFIIFIGEFSTFNKDAREFSADPTKENATTAIAYVIDNLAQKLIANFFIRINKPAKPVKLFNSEEDALLWLNQFVQ